MFPAIPHEDMIEPVCAGIIVSLLNRYVLNNPNIMNCCGVFSTTPSASSEDIVLEHMEENSSENTTISDTALHHHVN